ncbi:mitochondrial import translocase subunit Tom22 [Chiua virens]|nr:mitochondrial import translocase subunit Tom22 [Chiua virens]
MVKVEIVDEHNSPYSSPAHSRTNSTDSLSSVASDLSVPDESLYDRLSALVDIVSPTTRQSISASVSKTSSFIKKTGRVVGNIVWIVTTSALLVGLPLALSLEDEAKVVQQEQEMLAQQQGVQAGVFFTAPGSPQPFSSFFPQMLPPAGTPQPAQKAVVPPGF